MTVSEMIHELERYPATAQVLVEMKKANEYDDMGMRQMNRFRDQHEIDRVKPAGCNPNRLLISLVS